MQNLMYFYTHEEKRPANTQQMTPHHTIWVPGRVRCKKKKRNSYDRLSLSLYFWGFPSCFDNSLRADYRGVMESLKVEGQTQ